MKDKQKNTQIHDSSSTVQVSDEQQIYTKENSPAIDQEDQDIKQNKKDIKTLYTIGSCLLSFLLAVSTLVSLYYYPSWSVRLLRCYVAH